MNENNTNNCLLPYERRRTLILVKDLIHEAIKKEGINKDILLNTLNAKTYNTNSLDEFDLITLLYLEAELFPVN